MVFAYFRPRRCYVYKISPKEEASKRQKGTRTDANHAVDKTANRQATFASGNTVLVDYEGCIE